MSIESLRNIIHREVLRVIDRRTRRVPCIVRSYDGDQHRVKVEYQPEGTLSGWLQIQSAQVGLLIAPNIGDPGWIEFHEADRRAGVYVGSNHNDLNPPPMAIQAGEAYYRNESGQSIYFKNDGSLTAADGSGATLAMLAGTITAIDKANSIALLDGTGNIALTATKGLTLTAASIKLIASKIIGGAGSSFHNLVTDALVALFNGHTHPSNGSPPTQQMTSAELTQTFTAE